MTIIWFALNCEHVVSMLDINIELRRNDSHDVAESWELTHHLVEFVHLCIDREFLSCLQYFPVLRSMRNFCERIQVVFLKAQENVN